jgi:hypothetical protein
LALIRKKTAEEQAAAAAFKEQQQRQTAKWKGDKASRKAEQERLKVAQQEADQFQKIRAAFFASPAGQARTAFEHDDQVFQYAIDVMSQEAIIVAMVGSTTSKKTTDPTEVLNSVCNEGWELVNGSFVFVEHGQQSRDKFMSSGQNVAIKGSTVGYYLFRRCAENRRETTHAYEGAAEVNV